MQLDYEKVKPTCTDWADQRQTRFYSLLFFGDNYDKAVAYYRWKLGQNLVLWAPHREKHSNVSSI